MGHNKDFKTKRIEIRLTEAELNQIDSKAKKANLTRTDFLTKQALGFPVKPPPVPKVNWRVYRKLCEINKQIPPIGNNLNQISHNLHLERIIGENTSKSLKEQELKIQQFIDRIKEIQALLKQIQQQIATGKKDDR
jgi:septal ring factor EnvC (AmiA/AmiB activator)